MRKRRVGLEVNEDREQEEADARDAASLDAEGTFGMSLLLVPMLDVLTRLGGGAWTRDGGDRKFFAYLSRWADAEMKKSPEVGRAVHGVIIALREYDEACRK